MFTPRQKVTPNIDFQWDPSSWVFCAFRAFEVVFGRKFAANGVGDTIRIESMATHAIVDGKTVVTYRFFTWEAVLVNAEMALRLAIKNKLPKLEWVRVPQLQPAFAYGNMPLRPVYMLAIAYDTSSRNTAANAATCTINLTATGSNRIAIMGAQADNGFGQTAFVSLTVAGSSTGVTQIQSEIAPSATRHNRLYYFIAPPTSSTAYVLNSDQLSIQQDSTLTVATYSGAAQSSQPDSSAVVTTTTGTFSLTTTVVAANSWLVGTGTGTSPGNLSAGTSTTERSAGGGAFKYADSNAGVAAGSRSLQWVDSGSAVNGGIIASISPVAAAGPANMKSYNTNLKANIKSIDTNLLANIKSFDTNA